MKHTGRRGQSRGVTLLELLVALAIGASMLAVLYSTFFLSWRAVESLDTSMIKVREARMALDTLARELESSYYDSTDSLSIIKFDDRDIFGTPASALSFTTFSPLRAGLSLVEYEVQRNDADLLVLVKRISSSYADEPPENLMDVEMVEDIQSFTVEGLYGKEWVGTWDGKNNGKTPDTARIIMVVNAGDRQVELRRLVIPKVGKSL